jgi:uncharacterized MAPEG superfamily protein
MAAMLIAKACIFAAFCLIYIPRAWVFRAQKQMPGGLDNSIPRDQQAQLPKTARRAQGAHMNAFESFAPFAAAVLCAMTTGRNQDLIDQLAVAHIGLRVIYTGLYIADLSTARSAVWILSSLATAAIFVVGLSAS